MASSRKELSMRRESINDNISNNNKDDRPTSGGRSNGGLRVQYQTGFLILVLFGVVSLRLGHFHTVWLFFNKYWTSGGEDWAVSLSELEAKTLFKGMDMSDEFRLSLNGTPLDFLTTYRNPCWTTRLTSPDPYAEDTSYPREWRGTIRRMRHVMAARYHEQQPWRTRCVPLAHVIGVSKSGTADLYNSLTMHPYVAGGMKQTSYWTRLRIGSNSSWGKRPMPFKYYVDLFDEAGTEISNNYVYDHVRKTRFHYQIAAEATGSYLWEYDGWWTLDANHGLLEPRYILAHTLKRMVPRAKLIVILRNPRDRLYSSFRMKSPQFPSSLFHQLCVEQIRRWNDCIAAYKRPRICAYNGSMFTKERTTPGGITLRASLYVIFLRDWLKVFPAAQVKVIKAEEYYANRSLVLKQLSRFLGIRDIDSSVQAKIDKETVKNSKRNYGRRSKEPMLNTTRTLLDQFFQPYNERLAALLRSAKYLWKS